MSQPGRSKAIYLTGRQSLYHGNLAQFGVTEILSFNGMTSASNRSSLMLADNVMVSGLRQLDLYNLKLTGSLQTNCSLGSFSLRLVDVDVNAAGKVSSLRNAIALSSTWCDQLSRQH